jgi:hypothetical protein
MEHTSLFMDEYKFLNHSHGRMKKSTIITYTYMKSQIKWLHFGIFLLALAFNKACTKFYEASIVYVLALEP